MYGIQVKEEEKKERKREGKFTPPNQRGVHKKKRLSSLGPTTVVFFLTRSHPTRAAHKQGFIDHVPFSFSL